MPFLEKYISSKSESFPTQEKIKLDSLPICSREFVAIIFSDGLFFFNLTKFFTSIEY